MVITYADFQVSAKFVIAKVFNKFKHRQDSENKKNSRDSETVKEK